MSPHCLNCKLRMRGDLIGWRPVSIDGCVSGWECPRCQLAGKGDRHDVS